MVRKFHFGHYPYFPPDNSVAAGNLHSFGSVFSVVHPEDVDCRNKSRAHNAFYSVIPNVHSLHSDRIRPWCEQICLPSGRALFLIYALSESSPSNQLLWFWL